MDGVLDKDFMKLREINFPICLSSSLFKNTFRSLQIHYKSYLLRVGFLKIHQVISCTQYQALSYLMMQN